MIIVFYLSEITMPKSQETEKTNDKQRSEVIRDTLVLQLKLIVDGFRDLALMPVCLVASIFGLIKHKNNPGRYLYRVLSYGRMSEKWIGLFDEADKDTMTPLDYEDNKFDDLLHKTQSAFESKYIDPKKKEQLVEKLNAALNDINGKLSPAQQAAKDKEQPQP